MELDIDDEPPRRLARRFERAHFEGEARVACRLLAGPTRDFNVMARRESVRADVFARPLVGPMVIFPEAGIEWLVHVFAGSAMARSGEQLHVLASGSSLLADFRCEAGERIVIEGGGEIVLTRFAGVPALER
jgi:environmental stress-induced protein Ves